MPTYILGIGLSHNGSAVLMADGKVIVGIEKERLTRKKHDGGNDYYTVEYCLKAAGIAVNDLSLIVQCANFEKEINSYHYQGKRFFDKNLSVPIITLSHHLAHAYSAIATAPFNNGHAFVLDGCGSPYRQVDEVGYENLSLTDMQVNLNGFFCEKDSLYAFNNEGAQCLVKDFSDFIVPAEHHQFKLPTIRHSIGGFYSAASHYCFGNMDDVGKLMGLSPYGRKADFTRAQAFAYNNGRVSVNEEIQELFSKPAQNYLAFKANFNYYANMAAWVQHEVEQAILYTLSHRVKKYNIKQLAYAGGVALNALANTRIKYELDIDELHIEPAAGDNGLALGCAYYGYTQLLRKPKPEPELHTCFGKTYSEDEIQNALSHFSHSIISKKMDAIEDVAAAHLAQNKVIGWFQGGAEFGPRALGNRSILANPFSPQVNDFINEEIKCREDFRPFAPSVLTEDLLQYYEQTHASPYMLLVAKIKPEYELMLKSVVHKNGTSRVQTVSDMSSKYTKLIQAFKKKSGVGILLNTSFNKRGMPIVETPEQAIEFFITSKLDYLIMSDFIVEKKVTASTSTQNNENQITMIVEFLNHIGISTSFQPLPTDTFLPGVKIHNGTLIIDKETLLYPGDLLHEAGHIALMMPEERMVCSGNIGEGKTASEAMGEEIGAMLWSYAALHHLNLNPDVVFHTHGYKGSSSMFIENFTSGNYIGLPLLEWMGLCNGQENALKQNTPTFPTMLKWLRD